MSGVRLLASDNTLSLTSPVLTTPRRITLYWLLLLLPTLAVGTGALVLLARERDRLQEGALAADAVRRAAVEDRVQIAVENAALLTAEVQEGVLTTLRALPESGLDAALAGLENGNPFVRTAFLVRSDGLLLRPVANGSASATTRRFLRDFPQLLGNVLPWNPDTPEIAAPSAAPTFSPAQERANRNFVQFQEAREKVRQAAPSMQALAEADYADAATTTDSTLAGRSRMEAGPALADRSGWLPARVDNRFYLLGWLQPNGSGNVRGVELDIDELVSSLAQVLPVQPGEGERYELRLVHGETYVRHEVGAMRFRDDAEPLARLEISSVLPGWEIAGWGASSYAHTSGGTGWFMIAVLMVGIFVAAILAGGSLLLWQARSSEAEAAQKTSFVANVSHEFKTPLTTIRLYSELLAEDRVREPEKRGEYLRTIGRETQRLARLVGNVLDFSRLEQGKKQYRPEPLELVATLGALLDVHAPRIEEGGLRLIRDVRGDPLPVTTDRDALEQIVLNLIDNACKYAAAGGEVAVEAAPGPGGGVEVRVLDRGPGVPAAHRDRIFEKFHRVDDALTAEQSGAGLGLGIARQLARGLGGDLRYAPRPGGGSIFILALP